MKTNFRILFSLLMLLSAAYSIQSHAASSESIVKAIEPWTGDFEEMLERRQIRALVVHNKLMYFLDGARQHGASYDGLQEFAKFIDKKYDLGARKISIVYIPVTRDKIIPYLVDGIGDVASANLTITPEREAHIAFSDPLLKGVREILVTGPSAPEINGLEDLSGKQIYVRESSSYYANLVRMNEQLAGHNLEPIELVKADEHLEDSDLLEMVNAGLMPMIIVDSHKAEFWATIFENITARNDIAITVEASIAWAYRKNSPTMGKVINQFVAQNKKGTLIGNTIYKRYLGNNKWVQNAYSEENMQRYNDVAEFFQSYATEYGFDWLMLIALGYQESGLDHSARSKSGAVGIMQLLPSTASDPNVGIEEIEVLENNIHAGTKYLRFIRDRYFKDQGIDGLNQTLLAFASYNAGPAKITRIRNETRERGLDPNVWFGNVEHIAAKKIGRETVQYVSNIYKYYIAYKLLSEQHGDREKAREQLKETLE